MTEKELGERMLLPKKCQTIIPRVSFLSGSFCMTFINLGAGRVCRVNESNSKLERDLKIDGEWRQQT